VLGLFFVVPLVGGYLEHKAMGRMQAGAARSRPGPFGSLQLVADGIKFIQKEDIIPRPRTSGCSPSPPGSRWSRRC
jgi:NADH-quinone oxidoreductase subunit H